MLDVSNWITGCHRETGTRGLPRALEVSSIAGQFPFQVRHNDSSFRRVTGPTKYVAMCRPSLKGMQHINFTNKSTVWDAHLLKEKLM